MQEIISDKVKILFSLLKEELPILSEFIPDKAVRIQVTGAKAWAVISVAAAIGFTGCGIYLRVGDEKNHFIELDILTEEDGFMRPQIWTF